MDNLELKENKEQVDAARRLAEFQEEMAQFQEDERRGTRKSGHFLHTPGFNPKELTERDMAIWEKIKDRSITYEEIESYRAKVVSRTEDNNTSRGQFCQMIANLATPILLEKHMAKAKAIKEQQ